MKKALIGIMVLVLVVGGGVFLLNNNSNEDHMNNDMVKEDMNNDKMDNDMAKDDMDKDDMAKDDMAKDDMDKDDMDKDDMDKDDMDKDDMDKDDMDKDDMDKDDMAKDDMDKDDMAKDDMDKDEMDKDDMDKDDMASEPMMTNDGDKAPMFDLMDLEGNRVSLEALKGEKVYVKFWASWCSICLGGLEDLDNLTVEEKDFKVITIVSPDYNGEKSKDKFVKWFENQNHDNLIVLLDEDGTFTREFGVRGYPTSAFIGSDNVLVHLFPGHLENDMIKNTFNDIH